MDKPNCVHKDNCLDYDYGCQCNDYENVYTTEIINYCKNKNKDINVNKAMKDLFINPMFVVLDKKMKKHMEDKLSEIFDLLVKSKNSVDECAKMAVKSYDAHFFVGLDKVYDELNRVQDTIVKLLEETKTKDGGK